MTESSSKSALVTGASSGIGKAVAELMQADGWSLTGVTRDATRLGENIRAFELDLADIDSLEKTLNAGLLRDHDFNAVVLCAGAGDFGALEQFSSRRVRALIDLNLTSQVLLLRALIPAMKKRGSGRIVIIGSEAALAGKRNGAVYCATKFALRGLAQALRHECAPQGIAVTLINPGMVDTAFFDTLDFAPGDAPDQSIQADDVAQSVRAALSMRQGTVVDEINLSPQKHVVRSKS